MKRRQWERLIAFILVCAMILGSPVIATDAEVIYSDWISIDAEVIDQAEEEANLGKNEYQFSGNSSVYLSDLLETLHISLDSWRSVRVSADDPEAVEIRREGSFLSYDYRITALKHFDRAELTVATRKNTYTILLRNPEGIPAGRTVTGDAGSFTADKPLPAGTELRVAAYHPDEQTREKVHELAGDGARMEWLDISLRAEGNIVEAGATVTVKTNIAFPEVPEKYGISGRAAIRDIRLFHVLSSGKIEELPSDAVLNEEGISSLTFTTGSFSGFAISYTVDFEYEGGRYRMPGGKYIFLSDLLEMLEMGISVSDIADVQFSDHELLQVEPLEGDWRLTSLAPFTSLESLRLTLADGAILVIRVTDEQAAYHEDLSALLTNMILYVDGEEVQSGDEVDVRDGMLYDLVLTFQEKGLNQFSDTEQMYFDLPSGFVLPDGFTDSMTINLGIDGKVYGNKLTYDKENNRLLLDWNKEDRKYSRMTDAGNLRFTVRLQGYIQPGEVKYGDSYQFIANRYDPHNASVSKTGVLNADDLEHQKITYTVKVISDGSCENLILTDVLGTALSYSSDPVTWERTSLMEAQADARAVSATVVGTDPSDTEPSLQYSAEGMVISIPETHDGDVITFTYTADVDYNKISSSGNASFAEMGNTVQIFGDNDPIDNKAEFHQKEVVYSDLQKSVSEPSARYEEGGKEYQNLTWTIDTNTYKMISFRDTDITDRITVYTDSEEDPQVMDLPTEYIGDGITISVYEWNEDRSQTVLKETRNIPWSDLSVTDMDAAQGWTYHVPESDGIYEYRISYQTRTDVTGLKQNADVHNTAVSRGGMDEVSKLLHPKGNGLGVGKRVVNQTEDDVTWEITVYLNDIAEGWNQRLVIEDLLPYRYLPKKDGTEGSDRYKEKYIEGTLTVSGLQQDESYELFVSQPNGWWGDDQHVGWRDNGQSWDSANWPLIRKEHRYEGNENKTFKDNENNRNVFMVEFFKDKAQQTQGLNSPEDGGDSRTITIRFKTEINKEWRDWAWEYYGKDAIWNGLRHTNDVYANSLHEQADVIVTGNYLVKAYKGKATWTSWDTWRFETYIAGKQPGSTIVIDDYFDGDLWKFDTKIETQFRAGNEPNYAKSVSTPGHSEYWVEGEYGSSIEILEDGHVRFTISDLPLRSDGKSWPFYGVNYFLTPKDEEAWKKIQMQAFEEGGIARYLNTAVSEGMTDDDQYPVTLLPEYKPVDKSDPISVPDQWEMVEYSIVLNQQKQRLNDGNPFTMEDEFNGNLSIDYSSIIIATEPTGREEEVSYDYSGHVGTFVIPDETKVTITYRARVVPDKDAVWTDNKTEVSVYNVAHMLGWKDGGEKKITVSKGGDAEIYRIRLFKYGSGHMESGLNGAVFGLYEKVGDAYQPIKYPAGPDAGKAITFATGTVSMLDGIVIPDSDIGLLTEEEKGRLITRDGYALVELSQSEQGITLEKDKTYYLKEESVPEGYQRDMSVEYYSFTFDTDPNYTGGGWLYYNNDILKVRNSPNDGAFSIQKKISGNYSLSDEQLASLRFEIQKKNGESWESVTVRIPMADAEGNILYTETSALTYDQIREKLVVDHIGAGTFRVVESIADGGTGVPGSVDHTVAFTVDEIESELTEEDGNQFVQFEITEEDIANGIEHTIEMTNTYTQETITLKARKSWLDAENIARVPAGARVILGVYRVIGKEITGEPAQRVELDGVPDVTSTAETGEFASWTAQFAKLPKKDDAGNEITYAVKEISGLNGYDVFYREINAAEEWLELDPASVGTVINRQETVSFSVEKRWSITATEDAEITIGIYYGATEEEAYAKYTAGAKPYRTAVLPEEDKWTAVFDNLPKSDGSGNEYIWIAVETQGMSGYDAGYPEEGKEYLVLSNDPISQQIIVNGPRPVTIEITGEKVLIGKKLEGNDFEFILKPESSEAGKFGSADYPGGFSSRPQRMVTTNNAEGMFAFHLMYTAEDYTGAQTKGRNANGQICAYFYYVVEESIPTGIDYIQYDTSKFLVRIELRPDLSWEKRYYHYDDGIPEGALPAQPLYAARK